jgi:hypothetical protein
MTKWTLLLTLVIACKSSAPTTTTTGPTQTETACNAEACGPMPMFFQMCADGSGVGADRCERGPNGCAWQMQQCPTEPAPAPDPSVGAGTTGPAECTCQGDKPNMMALCADGKTTIEATGKCLATKDGCAWEMTKCP